MATASYPSAGYAPTPQNLINLGSLTGTPAPYSYDYSQAKSTPYNYSNAQSTGGKILGTYDYSQAKSTPTQPLVQPQPTSSGGGGIDWSQGLTGDQVRAAGFNPDTMISTNGLYYNSDGGSQQSTQQQLDEAYNPIFDYLNQAESNVRGAFPGIQGDINNQYGVSSNQLGTGLQQGMASLDQNSTKIQQTKEDAMAQARRLYNELIQGYGQRFGGSTSAGEAARVLAGNEAQRTMGGVNRDFGNNQALINQKKVEVEQNYQLGLQQLQATRDAALNQANRDFQQKLLDISNTRASTASEKAQQKLAALQELRNQAYNIQLQNQQFQQQLALQRDADGKNIDAWTKGLGSSMSAGNAAATSYNPQVNSSLQTSQPGVSGQSSLVGVRSSRPDELTGAISPQQSIYNAYDKYVRSPFELR